MNEATLLEYGLRELVSFRADMRTMPNAHNVSTKRMESRLCEVLRNADARRNAAGLTRGQAERACVLAAKTERHKAR